MAGRDQLRAGAEDDAGNRGPLTVVGVAGGVVQTGLVVQDRGPTVVTAVGVGLGEPELPVAVELGNGPIHRLRIRVRRIDDTRRVPVGGVQRVRRRHVAHERERRALAGQIQRQLRLRREAAHQPIVPTPRSSRRAIRNGDRAHRPTTRRHLVQIDRRRNPEVRINLHIVPNMREPAISHRHRPRRQHGHPRRDHPSSPGVVHPTDHQIPRNNPIPAPRSPRRSNPRRPHHARADRKRSHRPPNNPPTPPHRTPSTLAHRPHPSHATHPRQPT